MTALSLYNIKIFLTYASDSAEFFSIDNSKNLGNSNYVDIFDDEKQKQ